MNAEETACAQLTQASGAMICNSAGMTCRFNDSLWVVVLVAGLVVATACAPRQPNPALVATASSPPSAAKGVPPSSAAERTCLLEKLAFDRAHSCANDGAVEVCLAAQGTEAKEIERVLGPLTCSPSRGRAGCEIPLQINCRLPIDRETCAADSLSEQEWQRVCQLASFEFVHKVVATYYE